MWLIRGLGLYHVQGLPLLIAPQKYTCQYQNSQNGNIFKQSCSADVICSQNQTVLFNNTSYQI